MLCHVSLPDCVITEFKLREKARGQELLQAVRIFLCTGSKSTILLSTENFRDVGVSFGLFTLPTFLLS